MTIHNYQKWVTDFYKERGWYDLNAFIRVNFLTEEVGEVSRAIRTLEIGRDRQDEPALSKHEQLSHLKEELGDVLDNVFILADKYNLDITDILTSHQEKLTKRYEQG